MGNNRDVADLLLSLLDDDEKPVYEKPDCSKCMYCVKRDVQNKVSCNSLAGNIVRSMLEAIGGYDPRSSYSPVLWLSEDDVYVPGIIFADEASGLDVDYEISWPMLFNPDNLIFCAFYRQEIQENPTIDKGSPTVL
jgi:hypothetical protein